MFLFYFISLSFPESKQATLESVNCNIVLGFSDTRVESRVSNTVMLCEISGDPIEWKGTGAVRAQGEKPLL